MTIWKESDVKPQRGAQHLDEGPKVRVGRPDASAPAPVPTLSSEEVAVLECLQEAGTGLTLRQIGSRVSCEPDTLVQVVSVLVERDLVVRLNTIIPSYSFRERNPRVHAG